MQKTFQGNAPGGNNVREIFDAVISLHMQRLLGTAYGIGELPININLISCIILIAEQFKGRNEDVAQNIQYTLEMLHDELNDLSLDGGDILNTTIPDMIQRRYIGVDSDNIVIRNNTITMAKVLGKILPNMPGLNLIAYLGQSMDEVKSGRKSIETAETHLDHTLNLHGVPIKKRIKTQKENQPAKPQYNQGLLKNKILESLRVKPGISRSKVIKSADFSAAYQKPKNESSEEEVNTKNIAALIDKKEKPQQKEIKDQERLQPKEYMESPAAPILPPESENTAEEIRKEPALIVNGTREAAEISAKGMVVQPVSVVNEPDPVEKSLKPTLLDEKAAPRQLEESSGIPLKCPMEDSDTKGNFILRDDRNHKKDDKSDINLLDEDTTNGDENTIEKRIAAFEEGLAMQCPLCRRGYIRSQKTSKGKYYYVCTENNCTFISWGKPYHLVCPNCNNPFLVESSNIAGEMILKCPRATCIHWQKHPSNETEGLENQKKPNPPRDPGEPSSTNNPRKKVFVRKVVRKKR